MRYALFRRLILALLLALPLQPAAAAEGPWVEEEMVRARLIAAGDAVGEATKLDFGLEIELQPGWKTYWRSPGDAGIPPQLDWSASSNVAAVAFLWPAPLRFTLFGLDTFGYEERVVFPLEVTPARAGEAVTLAGRLTYMVCEEICIPFEVEVSLALPAGSYAPTPQAFAIESFRARVPGDGVDAGLAFGAAQLSGSVDRPQLTVTASSRIAFNQPDLIVEGPPGNGFRQPTVTLAADGRTATFTLEVLLGPQVSRPLEGEALTLTLVEGRRAAETRLVPSGELAAAADGMALPVALAPSDWPTLAGMLGLALLGGLILNLMPCVLPVLSLKLLSVVGQGGRAKGAIRASFLASAAGILVSFLLLAAALIGLKQGGLAIGWGLQFQAPLFLTLMALLVTLFAANLFGFFQLALPGAVARLGEAAPRHGLLGHFLTGFLATLLATPCSAPFLGTAVGFALAHDWPEILAIFAALGLGLALPYLLVAALPGLAQRLPKPGRWMERLKLLLGLALVGTAAWLLSVLWQQEGARTALIAGALLLALLLLLALRRHRVPAVRRALAAGAGFLGVVAVVLPLLLPGRPATAALGEGWVAFEEAAIPRLVAEGRVVFVDVTAEWCVTCLANKRLVLDRQPVVAALAAEGLVAMRADWTRPDPAIAAFLERFGRYGIPFNIVFGPGAPQGLPLSELLSEAALLEALATAGR